MKNLKKFEGKAVKNRNAVKGGNKGKTYVEHHNPTAKEGEQEFEVSVDGIDI
jgi:hypothetical protein